MFDGINVNVTKIYSVSKYTAPEGCYEKVMHYPTHTRCYELVYFVTGGSKTHFCGADMQDEPGSLRLMPKGKFSGEYRVSSIKAGYCIDVYFDSTEELATVAEGLLGMDFLRDKFEKIFMLWQRKKPGYYESCMTLLYEIICEIKLHKRKYLPSDKLRRIEASYTYMLENYRSKNFNYKALAKCSGLGYSYFSELFSSAYGTTPVKLVTRLRLDLAKEMLIAARYKIGEIAEMCGFENAYYFSKVFKQHFGLPPSKYAKSLEKDN